MIKQSPHPGFLLYNKLAIPPLFLRSKNGGGQVGAGALHQGRQRRTRHVDLWLATVSIRKINSAWFSSIHWVMMIMYNEQRLKRI